MGLLIFLGTAIKVRYECLDCGLIETTIRYVCWLRWFFDEAMELIDFGFGDFGFRFRQRHILTAISKHLHITIACMHSQGSSKTRRSCESIKYRFAGKVVPDQASKRNASRPSCRAANQWPQSSRQAPATSGISFSNSEGQNLRARRLPALTSGKPTSHRLSHVYSNDSTAPDAGGAHALCLILLLFLFSRSSRLLSSSLLSLENSRSKLLRTY